MTEPDDERPPRSLDEHGRQLHEQEVQRQIDELAGTHPSDVDAPLETELDELDDAWADQRESVLNDLRTSGYGGPDTDEQAAPTAPGAESKPAAGADEQLASNRPGRLQRWLVAGSGVVVIGLVGALLLFAYGGGDDDDTGSNEPGEGPGEAATAEPSGDEAPSSGESDSGDAAAEPAEEPDAAASAGSAATDASEQEQAEALPPASTTTGIEVPIAGYDTNLAIELFEMVFREDDQAIEFTFTFDGTFTNDASLEQYAVQANLQNLEGGLTLGEFGFRFGEPFVRGLEVPPGRDPQRIEAEASLNPDGSGGVLRYALSDEFLSAEGPLFGSMAITVGVEFQYQSEPLGLDR